MNIHSITCLHFSPTGTTREIARHIAQGINAEKINDVDMTQLHGATLENIDSNSDLIILASPVYYGRLPEFVASHLANFKATNQPVVLAVIYGNRAYDDALIELRDLAISSGMTPVAAGAFIGQHSYSSEDYPIAQGRPDAQDKQQAQRFGVSARQKLEQIDSLETLTTLTVPGSVPYVVPEGLIKLKEARLSKPMTPEVDLDICVECGKCADACPTGAIVFHEPTQTDRWKCILCMACVQACPDNARQMNTPNFKATVERLHTNCQERKEPEFFL